MSIGSEASSLSDVEDEAGARKKKEEAKGAGSRGTTCRRVAVRGCRN